eukprot:TRINITY_DN15290_c0_g1_i1.p3 TRINITY_DN15290_c0_g1~~TRINITY_DN15290_c0_g1_i1.p3  ORF type:complete len:102 (+),score=22.11 TRINITY_DN15290_c0_g1_i1:276-581(+)
MVATAAPEPPPLTAVRCVYRQWVVPAAQPPQMVWDDSGTSGPPGSLWQTDQLHLLVAVVGLGPGDDADWQLRETPFRMEPRIKKPPAGPAPLPKRPPPPLV